MPVQIQCEVFSVETGQSAKGFFANIKLLHKGQKKILEIFTKDEKMAQDFILLEGSEVSILIELNQSRFGLQFGQLIELNEVA